MIRTKSTRRNHLAQVSQALKRQAEPEGAYMLEVQASDLRSAPGASGGSVGGSGSEGGGIIPEHFVAFHQFLTAGADAPGGAQVDGIQSGHAPNGSRTEFDLEDSAGDVLPISGSLQLFLNGQHIFAVGASPDYTVANNRITLATAPQSYDVLHGWCCKEFE